MKPETCAAKQRCWSALLGAPATSPAASSSIIFFGCGLSNGTRPIRCFISQTKLVRTRCLWLLQLMRTTFRRGSSPDNPPRHDGCIHCLAKAMVFATEFGAPFLRPVAPPFAAVAWQAVDSSLPGHCVNRAPAAPCWASHVFQSEVECVATLRIAMGKCYLQAADIEAHAQQHDG